MGHSSKFVFPLPGRKQKQARPPTISAPLTKVQKILGSAEINIDSSALATDQKGAWETRSNSGISIAISDTTTGHTDGDAGLGSVNNEWTGAGSREERRWEDESEIIPTELNRQANLLGSTGPDIQTDASSLRRRQSSSTIRSFYDKSKLPLSISQQTSNSAMAKGLPPKAQALLDMDGRPPELRAKKKRPSRLDLSSLLHKHRSPKWLHPESDRSQVLGSDAFTTSPSVMSVSSALTPPPIPQRADRSVRKMMSKDPMREKAASPNTHALSTRLDAGSRSDTRRRHVSKSSTDLYNLYDHYEQRSFADAMDEDFDGGSNYRPERPPDRQISALPTPPASTAGNAFLSPFPSNPSRTPYSSPPAVLFGNAKEARLTSTGAPSSPVSLTADCASVSSRHTRTSKASKRTDRSMTEIDLLQNSVLALSSDSEDDYEVSSKGSLAVPTLSDAGDGQASPTSLRSGMSQLYAAEQQDASRSKPVKRASFASDPQFFPANRDSTAAKAPKVKPRSSSLTAKPSLAHQMSRLSVGTASTGRTVSRISLQSQGSRPASVTNKTPKSKSSDRSVATSPADSHFDFPAPPSHRAQRSSRASGQTSPLSPTTVDLCPQSHHSPVAYDNGSIRSGVSVGSAVKGGRRGSATSSINDGSSGRLMAVTRQEEMLLAALRMKRARMREDIIAEFEGEMEREEHQLKREMTNESVATSGGVSRQSSRSTMRLEAGTLSARPRQQIQPRTGTGAEKEKGIRGQALPALDQPVYETTLGTTEPGVDSREYLQYDDGHGSLSPDEHELLGGKAGPVSGHKVALKQQRASLTALAEPRKAQRREGGIPPRPLDQASLKGQSDVPHQILEDPAEDEQADIPRPDSPISPSDFPAPASISRKKQVRLSAVGCYKPNIEAQWWDDSG
ncbi:hypothetical protein VTK56DRAFT_3001 [Thermocarpiscus australiensis]